MSGNYPPPNQSGGGNEPRGPQYQGPGGPYPGGSQNQPGQNQPPQQPYGQGTPSGPPPGYSGPGGQQQPYPAYGQGPQGQYNQGQYNQGQYGQQGPGGPGQPPNQPYQQQPPGQKKGFPVIPVVIGVVVLALILGTIGIVAALNGNKTPTADPGTSTAPSDPGGGGSSAPPANVTKPSDAVKAYLDALAASNAAAAIALSDTAPADETFLTDAVLQASNKIAPITDIKVPDVTDEYAYKVSASFKLGKQQVDESFSVTKAGDTWKLRDAFNDSIDMGSRAKGFPTIINGVQAKASKLRLFPGAYQFTTGSENVSWGEEDTLIVQSPSDYPRGISDLKPTVTDKGAQAFTAAVKASLNACLKSKKLTNPGCPNNIDPKRLESSYKIKDGTLNWEASRPDALDNTEIRLDYRNATEARAIVSFGLTATAECSGGYSDKCTVYPRSSVYPRANMVASTIKVTWGSI